MKKILVLIITAGLLINCQTANSKPKPIDYRETPIPTDTNMCGAAEKHLTDLCQANPVENDFCCMTIQPTVKLHKSFTQFCQETQSAGIQLNPKCLSNIKTCEEINSCLGTTK